MTSLLEDYFATLYAFCGGMPQPVPPEVAAAFNTFVHAFAWLCPSLVHAEEDWQRPICVPHNACPFEPVATIHEWVAPESFQGDALVEKYLVQGVPKEEWGHRLWRLLHHTGNQVTPTQMHELLQACSHLLPCPQCRNHLTAMVHVFPPPGKCRTPQYISDVHNLVNMRLGKAVVGTISKTAQQVVPQLKH
jgi:hypothetical protein